MTTPKHELTLLTLIGLAATSALGSIAIHMMVPALPAIASDFEASPDNVQLAVSLYLLCLGAGQLLGGAASDTLGKRLTLGIAVCVFFLGALGVAISQNVGQLISARCIQALGGGASIIATRTLVAERSKDGEVAGRIAVMTSIVLLSPAVSPFLGGLIVSFGSWRVIFYLLTIIAALSALFVIRLNDPSQRATSGRLAVLGGNYSRVARSLGFWRLAIAIACASAGMYVFLSGSSFLLIEQYGLSPDQAGFGYLLVAASGICGTFLVKRLERGPGAFRTGQKVSCAGAFLLLLSALSGFENGYGLIAPMLVVGVGVGMSAPAGFAAVLKTVKGAEGASSSLAGAFQMLLSGLAATLIAKAGVSDLLSLASVILGILACGLLVAPARRSARQN